MLCHKLCQYQRANGLAIKRVVTQIFRLCCTGESRAQSCCFMSRRFPQDENDQPFWVFQKSSWVLEDHREIPQPGNRLARLIQSGFP